MPTKSRTAVLKTLIGLLLLSSTAASIAAYVDVGVGFFELSPNPVTIQAGDVVYWYEADPDFGPYIISGPWGYISTPNGLQFNTPGTYPYSAASAFGGSWDGTVIVNPGVPNSPPVVTITNPTNNAVFTAPATFAFQADASDPDPDDLWDVEFWVGDQMVDDVYSFPYATTVTNLAAGTYTLKAIAWDYSFETATNSITITVANPGSLTLAVSGLAAGKFQFSASGLTPGKTHVLQSSTNLASPANWTSIATNVAASTTASFTNNVSPGQHFFRLFQLP